MRRGVITFQTHNRLTICRAAPAARASIAPCPPSPAAAAQNDAQAQKLADFSMAMFQVGTIGIRAGVPVDVDQWGWSCGFLSSFASHLEHHDGTAEDPLRQAAGPDFEGRVGETICPAAPRRTSPSIDGQRATGLPGNMRCGTRA